MKTSEPSHGRTGPAHLISQSEDRFRALVEASEDAIVLLGADGSIQWASPSITRQMDYSLEDEFLGRRFHEFIHPEDRAKLLSTFNELLSQPASPISTEFRVRRKDGAWRWIEASGKNLLDDERVGAIVCNYRDVTEKKAALEALRKRDERFRTLIEYSSDIITILEPSGAIRYMSPSLHRVSGFSPEEIGSSTIFEMIHPDDVRGVTDAIARAVRNLGIPQAAQFRVQHRSGEWRYLEGVGRALVDESGAPYGIINVRDVTERRLAEDAHKQSEEYFRTLLENAPDIITVIDPTGAVRYESPSIERTLGYKPGEMEGVSIFQIIHPADVPAVSATIGAAVRDIGVPQSVQFRMRNKDGEWRHLEAVGTVVLDESGAPYGVINSRDVTERVRAEEALGRSEERNHLLMERALDVIIRINSNRGASRESLVKGIKMLMAGDSPVTGNVPMGILDTVEDGESELSDNSHSRLSLLTEREVQMLRFLCKGNTNKEIAAQMHYSVGTIKNMVQSVIEKLGVSDRTQAAVYAVRAGIDVDDLPQR